MANVELRNVTKHYPGLEVIHGIDVKVAGTTVYLTGHVATSELREKAHAIAHGTPGVVNVIYDGLTVQ